MKTKKGHDFSIMLGYNLNRGGVKTQNLTKQEVAI